MGRMVRTESELANDTPNIGGGFDETLETTREGMAAIQPELQHSRDRLERFQLRMP